MNDPLIKELMKIIENLKIENFEKENELDKLLAKYQGLTGDLEEDY